MRKAVTYLFVIIAFIGINLYLGIRLIKQVEEFRLKSSSITVKVISEHRAGLVRIKDIDNDGEDEFVFCQNHTPDELEYFIFDLSGKSHMGTFTDRIVVPQSYHFYDVYYDNKLNILIFRFLERVGREIFLKDEDIHRNIHKTIKLEGLNFRSSEGSYRFRVLSLLGDLESDGKRELFIRLYSGFDRYPRGIVCVGPESGKLLWEYYCGPHVWDGKLVDLDGNGRKEVIMSTSAVNNGVECNETTDAHSYVIVLAGNGKEWWKKITGGWYTHAHSDIEDLDNDGTFEIVTTTGCHQVHNENRGQIFIFNGLTGEQKKHFFISDGSFSRPFVYKINTNQSRIYVGDSRGRIWMFDGNLDPLKIKAIVKEDVPIVLLNNPFGIWRAGEWPYLLACTPTRLLVYDKELSRKILDYTFARPIPFALLSINAYFAPGKSKQRYDAFVSTDKLYHLHESKFSPGKILKNLSTSGLLYTIIILLLFNVFCIYFTFGLKKTIFPPSRQESETKPSGFLEILQGIAHQLKNPISTILWTVEKIKRSSAESKNKNNMNSYRQLSDFLLEDVGTLRKQTDNMLKMLRIQKPRFRQKSLKPLLEQLVEQYRTIVDEKTEIRLKMEEDISLYIDDELFKDAIVILIDDAVEVMPEGCKISISVTSVPPLPDSKGRIGHVSIEVENTGRGMDENERSQAFTPLFSKKEKDSDIGLDLTICRQIIEAHEGKLEVQRRNGLGTSAKLIIPLKKRPPEE